MKEHQTVAIDVVNLHKTYDGTQVLRGGSLQIREGEFFTLMGPNGSGKSTLISIIAGTNPFDLGSIEIFGKSIVDEKMEARAHIGYVPQQNFCSAFLTGRENLEYFAGLLGLSKSEKSEKIDDLLEMMELEKDADRRVSEYSGGMRKKLEVATALLGNVKILLLDEPTTGLDPNVRKEFLSLLTKINRRGTVIFLVTHIGEDAEYASRIGFIVDGNIVIDGGPDELKEKGRETTSLIIRVKPVDSELLILLAGLDDECIVVEHEDYLRITCKKSKKLIPLILDALRPTNYELLSIDSTTPSLEDVFYQMTNVPLGGEVK